MPIEAHDRGAFLHSRERVKPPAAHSFPSCRKRMGRKGALGDAGCILRCDSGRNLIYRYYEHTDSPYERFGTRRLLRDIRFTSGCL